MLKDILKLSFFSVIILFVGLVLRDYFDIQWIHDRLGLIIFFYWAMSMCISATITFLEKNMDIETHFLLLAGVSFRLILALFGFLLIHQVGIDNFKLFGLNFSVLYLLFLVFEITNVLPNLRPNSSENQADD